MKRFGLGAGVVLAWLVIGAGAAHAQYGALAYDSDTRLWGRATNVESPREADRIAIGYCRSGGCQVVVRTGPRQCGAIAAAQRGTRYHWSTRPYRREAEFGAIEGCEREAGGPCELIVVQCNE